MRTCLSICLIASLLVLLLGGTTPAEQPRELSPPEAKQWHAALQLLQARCVSCHGPETQEGGLRLDRGPRILTGGDSGKAVVAGKPADSPLLDRVTSDDDDIRMPPPGEGTPLNAAETDLLRTWIQAGAPWAPTEADQITHWAFLPIQRPALPQELSRDDWVRNAIDAFVLRQLDERGIAPAPEADRATLIRRVYLDLLGLPPTPAEFDAFINDTSPSAYDAMVSPALESPHYGERWGRHWLDLARYADSDGYEKDRPRPNAWRYREWVIQALNDNMPFDQFTIEQIAGDLLESDDPSPGVATGFHRNTLHNTEGGTDKEEDRVKKTVDRTNTVGSIWMGLTVGCAQCHSHKYDPITQREYYQLYGFFNDIDERDIPAPTAKELQRHAAALAKHHAELQRLEAARDEYEEQKLPQAQAEWEKTAATDAAWRAVDLLSAESKHGAQLEPVEQGPDAGALLATGPNETSDLYTLRFTADAPVAAIRLEVLPDKRLPKSGPGRAENGNFVLTTVTLQATPPDGETEAVALVDARADFAQDNWQPAKALNDNDEDGWAVSPEVGKRHVAAFSTKTAIPAGAEFTLVLDQNYARSATHNLGKFRLTVSDRAETSLDGLPSDVAEALQLTREQRSDQQRKAIAQHYRKLDKELQNWNKKIADHERQRPKLGAVAQAVVERSDPRQTRVLLRGDFLNPGDPVERQGLATLPPITAREGSVPDRLDLARWLVADDNPLTARVTVNRIWQRYFGRGIVASVDDFGSQGDAPTHPDLLDWLACELRDHHWNLKRLHRLIVSSATYRQSSQVRPELRTIDPDNTLLARHPRQRVEAEIVRDLSLAVAGLLNPKVGGPSVRPPQPSEYSKLTYANSAKWNTSENGDQYRRGLYTFFQRTSPYPMLMTFDSPDSNQCTARRSESNTPLQALTLWNDVVFFECSQHLGRRIVAAAADGDTPQRLAYAWKLCFAGRPSEQEQKQLLSIHQRHKELCHAASAEELQALLGDAELPADAEPAEVAAWVLTGRVLLNLDAFIVKQ